ncbi:MAG: hypothetical protein ACK4SN_14095, partial [Bellilinea sp.]
MNKGSFFTGRWYGGSHFKKSGNGWKHVEEKDGKIEARSTTQPRGNCLSGRTSAGQSVKGAGSDEQ